MPNWRAKRMINTALWYVCTGKVSADRDYRAGLILAGAPRVAGRRDAFGGCSASQMAQMRFFASLSTTSHDRLCAARTRDGLCRQCVCIHAAMYLAT